MYIHNKIHNVNCILYNITILIMQYCIILYFVNSYGKLSKYYNIYTF